MGIFANLKWIFACLLQGIWDIRYPPIQASLVSTALVSDTRYLLYSIYYYIYDDALVVNIRKRHIC